MSTVLVHNQSHRNEASARSALPSAAAVRREFWWNVWKPRLAPYGLIADGMPILLLDSWPGGGILSWLVSARNVRVGSFSDKKAAITALAKWTGWTRAEVLSNPYTGQRRPDAGHTIFWQATPLGRLDAPRPPQLAVRRNGWLVTDTDELNAWGVNVSGGKGLPKPVKSATRGQGRRADKLLNAAVEFVAMSEAKAWCKRRGWTNVKDVSGQRSWDLEARDAAGRLRYIEAKGTTGLGASVEVTYRQAEDAKHHGADHAIVIVSGIKLSGTIDKPLANGGTVTAYDPWRPLDSELVPETQRWTPLLTRRASG